MIGCFVLLITASSASIHIPQIEIDQNNDIPTVLDDFELVSYDQSKAMDGYNVFVLWERDETVPTWGRSILSVMDMEGNFINTHIVEDGTNRIYESEMYNSTTVLFLTSGDDTPYLWNFKTDTLVELNFPSGHHDIEYNPFTDTFLVKRFAIRGMYDGLKIQHHDLYEYDRDGNVLWYWNSTQRFSFNQDLWTGETFVGQIQYVHANSIFWEFERDKIYYNSKNFDTFYQIDKSTKQIDWGLGRLGNFTLLDEAGNEVDSLWYHAHSVEKIGPDRFILYDNDAMNQSRDDPSADGITKIVEIKVNMKERIAQRVWTYSSPSNHFSPVWGDADRLPNGNSIASFGHFAHDAFLTEVNKAGEVVWEVAFNRDDTHSWGIFRVERFLETPLVKQVSREDSQDTTEITLSTWNTIRHRYHSEGTITIKSGSEILVSEVFRFKPHWQATLLNYEFEGYEDEDLIITITNNEGIQAEFISSVEQTPTSSDTSGVPLDFWTLPTFAIIAILIRYKNK